MSSKGLSKSAASIRVKSIVKVQSISPAKARTVGVTLSKKQAVELARNLLVLACSDDIQGDIVITGHLDKHLVSVLGYKKWRRNAADRNLALEQLVQSGAPPGTA